MQPHYREDIQGLRALAVLLVFASHAHVTGLSAGFIGVDIFFVISGYVITALLYRERENKNKIDLMNFYARRALRLFPALLVVLLATLTISFFVAPPYIQSTHLSSLFAAALWISNLHFIGAQSSYFEKSVQSDPYLHTWSLGVEEQFYLVWPFLVIAIFYLITRFSLNARKSIIIVMGIGIISFALQLALVQLSPMHAFYQMPARIWEFALGAGMALFHLTNSEGRHKWRIAPIGYLLIVISLVLIDKSSPYPGWRALLPALGTALILLQHRNSTLPEYRLLTTPVIKWVGDRSYAIYLWHWPLLVLLVPLRNMSTWFNPLSIFVATLVISGVSYRWIENPFRHNARMIKWPAGVLIGMVGIITILITALPVLHASLLSTYTDNRQEELQQMRMQVTKVYSYDCDSWYNSSDVKPCVFGPQNASHKVVLLGDSVLIQWFSAMAPTFLNHGWQLVVLTKSACPIVNSPYFYTRIRRVYSVCDDWRSRALTYVTTLNPDLVIFGNSSDYPFTKSQWQKGSSSILQSLQGVKSRLALLLSTPVLSFNGLDCVAREAWLDHFGFTATDLCQERWTPPESEIWLKEIAKKNPRLTVLDFSNLICPKHLCQAERGGTVALRDDRHMTERFAKSLAAKVAPRLAPLLDTNQ